MKWLWLVLLCLLTGQALADEPPRTLQLLARSSEEVTDPGLSQAQWRWLREHRKLRFALWQPMLPPYDITTGLNDYGGINADFVGLLAENLGVEIEVKQYPSYSAVLAALRAGEVDFIAEAGDNQKRQGLILSKPYSHNVAVEVVNGDNNASVDKVRTVAVYPVYDRQKIMERYPNASLVNFASARHAMEALAFHNIDLFFCDAVTARYLVSQSNLSNLRIRTLTPPLPSAGFAFAATERMRPWIDILNVMLSALPESAGIEIHRRWNGGIPLSLSELPPVYTSLESKWINEHKHIRVAVAEGNAPVAFFDESGQLRGMIADILTALRLRTGFTFEIQRYPSQAAAYAAVQSGRSELVAGGSQEGIWQAKLLTTRTWLYNSWVMVGRTNRSPGLPIVSVASLRADAPEEWLRRQAISQLTRVDTWREGLGRVLRRESDIMIVPLIVANELLAQKAYASLKIIASLDDDPLRLSFGASREAWPLVTILNKALINIPPEDLHALTRSGYTSNSFSTVPDDNSTLYSAAWVALLIAAGSGVWLWRSRWRRMMRTMDALPAPVYVCDRRGRLLAGNRAMRQALGVTARQLRGTTLDEWLDGAQQGGRTVEHAGRKLRLWRTPVRGKRYRLGGWLDVTRQRHLIASLQRARRRADGASREKSTFLTTMSHEIRTPLSAVIGMLELVMHRGGDSAENRQSLRVAREAAQSLLELLGNILDVSRIESGRMVLHPQRVALRELIESTAVMFEGLAAQKGLRFVLEIDAQLNVDVLVDAMRLRQIMANLVANAIKFTDRGDVVLRARPLGHEGDRLRLSVEITDTGEGIAPEVQARLFKPFEQAESRRMAQGSGLGLYISHTLAQMMGGDVTLHSQPGEGTTMNVTLTLPVMATLTPVAPDAPDMTTCGARELDILIVDDNPAGRLLLSQQLSWFGHRVVSRATGQEALDYLAQAPVDVVISDCNMPGMSGFTLAARVRERWPTLPFFGITADARESVRGEARQAGMTDCLFKPVTLAMLETLMGPFTSAVAKPGKVEKPVSDPQPVAEKSLRQRGETEHDGVPAHTASCGASVLPAALLTGENLALFLTLQITVLDETLASIAQWRTDPQIPLSAALHRLCGGIQLLGANALVACCREQEHAPDDEGLQRLERKLHTLRAALLRWQQTGLQPAQNVLQGNEEEPVS